MIGRIVVLLSFDTVSLLFYGRFLFSFIFYYPCLPYEVINAMCVFKDMPEYSHSCNFRKLCDKNGKGNRNRTVLEKFNDAASQLSRCGTYGKWNILVRFHNTNKDIAKAN